MMPTFTVSQASISLTIKLQAITETRQIGGDLTPGNVVIKLSE